jgi:hypothetical protein
MDSGWSPMVTRGTVWTPAVLIGVVILTMILSTSMGQGADTGRPEGSIKRLEEGLAHSGNGTAARIEHALDAARSLVWGHEGPDDLRVVNDALTTLGVLTLPSPGFHVKGSSIAEGGDRALVWGSTDGMANDALLLYDLTTLSVVPDFLPDGLIDLMVVDYARFYAWDVILAVAGRGANGSSELVFIETGPMQTLLRHTMPGNASVQYLGNDGLAMACLLDDGHLVVISTRDWSLERTATVVDGPFTAWQVTKGLWYLGCGDGTVVVWDNYFSRVLTTLHMDGAVQGVCQAVNGLNHTLVVATPSPDGGSSLTALRSTDGINWTLAVELGLSVPVSMLHAHPTRPDAVLVCHDDGSLEPFEVWTWEEYNARSGIRPIYIGLGVAVLVGVLALLLWSRRRHRAARPE